ncbi:MAG: SDR family oxidoreductase [Firmicutes bacterium]|nr:SDR family oxidoreductase [Alicyclobacillaceae bacterium]MCL6496331.1 SDR family oxidoreductase [Bacillota bacterium]
MRVAVTGSRGGIGQALLPELVAAGHEVVGFVRQGGWALDLTWPPERMAAVVAEAARPPFDVWINLAGADILSPPLGQAPFEDRLRALWAVDVLGTVRLCRLVATYLSPGGQVINLGWDDRGAPPTESAQLYGLAKAAVTAYSQHLARAWGGRWRCNVVAPGWVRTRWAETLPVTRQAWWAHRLPGGRWLEPGEVARAIRRLAEDPTANGAVVRVQPGTGPISG